MDWSCAPEISMKLILAVILGGVLGLERQRKGRGAGLRTHILVCLGATVVMTVSDVIVRQGGGATWTETARIAAGIITGIGFLGAGTIMTVGSEPRGLTTAATIWFSAALGIAIGTGLLFIALASTALALVVVLGFEYVEYLLPGYEHVVVTVRMPNGMKRLSEIEKAIQDRGFRLSASRIKVTGDDESADMTFELTASAKEKVEDLTALLLEQFPSVERVTFER